MGIRAAIFCYFKLMNKAPELGNCIYEWCMRICTHTYMYIQVKCWKCWHIEAKHHVGIKDVLPSSTNALARQMLLSAATYQGMFVCMWWSIKCIKIKVQIFFFIYNLVFNYTHTFFYHLCTNTHIHTYVYIHTYIHANVTMSQQIFMIIFSALK